MIGRRARALSTLVFCLDLMAVPVAFVSAYLIRIQLPRTAIFHPLYPLGTYLWLLLLIVPTWALTLWVARASTAPRMRTLKRAIMRAALATAVGALVLAALAFGLKLEFLSRSLVALFAILHFVLMVLFRVVVALRLRAAARHGERLRWVVVVGEPVKAAALAEQVADHADWGLRVRGLVHPEHMSVDEALGAEGAFPVLGTVSLLPRLLAEHVVDDVLVTARGVEEELLGPILSVCESMGVTAHIAAGMLSMRPGKVSLQQIGSIPLLTVTTSPDREGLLMVKRLLDAVIAFAALVLLSPLMALTAVAIWLESGRPILYRQIRLGRNGRRFGLYKFRSMVADADAQLQRLAHLNEVNGPAFKIKQDPRITRVGRIIRRTSIDELPQLFNVLRGDMSLVGPRPPLPSEVENYDLWQHRRLSVKPGMTGLWQVSGRNLPEFNDWVQLDLAYIDSWSLWMDFKILLKTVPVVLTGKGAA
jgi:exopolysaccharide biosynthesis polyprenyl glycosylphosphotransferase